MLTHDEHQEELVREIVKKYNPNLATYSMKLTELYIITSYMKLDPMSEEDIFIVKDWRGDQ